ncbi:hypothetical protein L7F22_020293 [Adiantum nelumboides]|nr:hypothetical protein [Adiantum nelumboides]
MASQALAVVPPASCPFPLSRTKRPPFLRASPFSCVSLSRFVAFQGIAGGPLEIAKAQSIEKRWLVQQSSSHPPNFTTRSTFNFTRWLALLLYRALLVGGLGLSIGRAAIVQAAPAISEVVMGEASIGKKESEISPQEAEGKEATSLGDEFWKGVDLARGSDELILKKVLDSDPTNLSALECLAKTLMEDDDLSRALMVLEKLQCLQPDEYEWKYLKADVYDLDGKPELAKKIFEDILKVDPFSSRALQVFPSFLSN